MSKKNYIPAFSIVETSVSLVISAVIVGLIFVIFTILSERMNDFKNQNQYVADLNRMTYSFNKDIFESEKMVPSDSVIVFYSYSGNAVKYSLYLNYFIRIKDAFVDTFFIPIKRIKLDTIQNKTRNKVFQRLTLNVDVNKESMQLKFFKKVYSNELLKKDFDKQ